ncbi:MAG TPA: 50S ribosomal protein L11 methyltransferase [Alphaproteobacteria bacterium]|nr:50S ribosomal protein L11 methyltransferase [Alphaproteobacteria bacterium]
MTGEAGEPRLWSIRLVTDRVLGPAIEEALQGVSSAVSRFEEEPLAAEPGGRWIIEAICEGEPAQNEIKGLIAAAAGAFGAEPPDFKVAVLEDTDWLALNRQQFPPVTVGRFFIHGSHFDGTVPEGKTVLTLDAGRAFGSGTHGSTQGALLAIDRCLDEGAWDRVLDIGCGSGILAMAIAASSGAHVVASDIDEAAVETLRANAEINDLDKKITALCEEGVGPGVCAHAPYGLIAANILAEPLIAMAADLREVAAAGGILILSGLIAAQEKDVLAAYREAGFAHRMTLVLGPWSTLVVIRRSRD